MNARGLPDELSTIRYMAESFEYERDILQQCNDEGMSKVIRSYSTGSIHQENYPVPYIVFEMADGDIRKHSISQADFDLAWVLRTMHHVSIGLKQLHGGGISHQDIKPSNILLVDEEDRKIGDFGTCVTKECKLPHAEMKISGDATYAPPEALYGYMDPEWSVRRYGTDTYQLGSLMVFMIVGIPASTLLLRNLEDEYSPARWSGTYEEVLPYLDEAFIRSVDIINQHLPDDELKVKIVSIIKELCDPSLFKRGDPVLKQRNSNPFNMERYVSRLDLLAKKLEHKLFRQ